MKSSSFILASAVLWLPACADGDRAGADKESEGESDSAMEVADVDRLVGEDILTRKDGSSLSEIGAEDPSPGPNGADGSSHSDPVFGDGSLGDRREGDFDSEQSEDSPVGMDTGLDDATGPCDVALKLTVVASGLTLPVFATSPPGDGARLFVVEQTGTIRIVQDAQVLPDPFLDIRGLTTAGGERGLLGLAFHPTYASSGRFFVNYTDLAGDTVVAEYRRSASDPDRAEPQAHRILFTVDQPFSNHNGGMIAFGPDGFLYVGMGDGGSGGDPQGHGQNLQSKLGKILRVDVEAYPVPPPGNLVGGDPSIWDFGLRNPWRFSFDRKTGDLYIADVGQNAWEEINVEPVGQGLRNYGWNVMEGSHCYKPPTGCPTAGLVMPVHEYPHSEGCSVTGGYVYRGSRIPCLNGRYFFGDFCSNRVWSFRWSEVGGATDLVEHTDDLRPEGGIGGLASFGEDAAGEIYLVGLSGRVFRLDPE